jgi:hypothetical protein
MRRRGQGALKCAFVNYNQQLIVDRLSPCTILGRVRYDKPKSKYVQEVTNYPRFTSEQG